MKTAQQLTAEVGTAEAIAAFVAECEATINQIDPELSYQRSELSGFVRACWPCEGFPADVAAEFANEVRKQNA